MRENKASASDGTYILVVNVSIYLCPLQDAGVIGPARSVVTQANGSPLIGIWTRGLLSYLAYVTWTAVAFYFRSRTWPEKLLYRTQLGSPAHSEVIVHSAFSVASLGRDERFSKCGRKTRIKKHLYRLIILHFLTVDTVVGREIRVEHKVDSPSTRH